MSILYMYTTIEFPIIFFLANIPNLDSINMAISLSIIIYYTLRNIEDLNPYIMEI